MVELVMGNEEKVAVGRRVMVFGGHRGTVCYVGPVPPYEGTWLGIDWDEPSRGKHDGTHQGVRYFTSRHPTSGSFVRLEKVNLGRSCVEAIKLRYGANSENNNIVEEELKQIKKAFNAPFVEMVGFDKVNEKQSCYENLEGLWLDEYEISNAGNENELKGLCPIVRELHLSKNLLSNWFDVINITKQLDRLTLLNLSENLLQVPDEREIQELYKQDAFGRLLHIILRSVNYTWKDILRCSSLWPDIRILQVPFNNITEIESPAKHLLHSLRELDVEGNNIEDWEQINKLGLLPSLETLNVSNTGISKVSVPSSDLFPSLRYLVLSNNKISSWTDISELDKLPIRELKSINNPVQKNYSKETSRQLFIAILSTLEMLNGQKITPEERRGAEYDYIKRYGKEWHDVKENQELLTTFIKEHHRYKHLIEKYGEAEKSEYSVTSTRLKANLVNLEICNTSGQKLRKSLPRSMLVQRLTCMIQKFFNTGSFVPVLYVVSGSNPELKILMNNPLKTLDYYSLEDGDKILAEY